MYAELQLYIKLQIDRIKSLSGNNLALVVLGLFSPERYNIEKHLGYDVKLLKDKYRSLSILKNRLGLPNLKKGLYFDGAVNEFFELPPPGSPELNRIYEVLRM